MAGLLGKGGVLRGALPPRRAQVGVWEQPEKALRKRQQGEREACLLPLIARTRGSLPSDSIYSHLGRAVSINSANKERWTAVTWAAAEASSELINWPEQSLLILLCLMP